MNAHELKPWSPWHNHKRAQSLVLLIFALLLSACQSQAQEEILPTPARSPEARGFAEVVSDYQPSPGPEATPDPGIERRQVTIAGQYQVQLDNTWYSASLDDPVLFSYKLQGEAALVSLVGNKRVASLLAGFDIDRYHAQGGELLAYWTPDLANDPATTLLVFVQPLNGVDSVEAVANDNYTRLVNLIGRENIAMRFLEEQQAYETVYAMRLLESEKDIALNVFYFAEQQSLISLTFIGTPESVVLHRSEFWEIFRSFQVLGSPE